jgi:hypothetical protein
MDIQRLLDKYRVFYRGHGKNVSAGNIVLSCCFCNKTSNPDPGEHLAVHLATGTYFCYRNRAHKGHVTRIFRYLNIPSHEYKELSFKNTEVEAQEQQKDFSLFRHFKPAEESQECLDYLAGRGFSKPLDTSRRFKLCFDLTGRWAGRLIIPLTAGWTGRSMRDHIEPRYLTESNADGFFFFKQNSTSCLIVEGPLDAIRVASVTNQFDVVAKCTNGLRPAILTLLREVGYLSIYNVPDGDVNFPEYYAECKELRYYCSYSDVIRMQLPEGFKDFCSMPELAVRNFLLTNGVDKGGGARGRLVEDGASEERSYPGMGGVGI